jgi:hypothetical protein
MFFNLARAIYRLFLDGSRASKRRSQNGSELCDGVPDENGREISNRDHTNDSTSFPRQQAAADPP